MDILKIIPLRELANNLGNEINHHSGFEGALIGAGLGALASIISSQDKGEPIHEDAVLTGVMIGLAYGAADKRLLANMTWKGARR